MTGSEMLGFEHLTEQPGQAISLEQLDRTQHRYLWCADYASGKDVLEAACGSGLGLPYLASKARSLIAGDIDPELLIKARRMAPGCRIEHFPAEKLPVPDNSMDCVILLEAIYYLKSTEMFVRECQRVLRPGGMVLIVSANKDLFDFTPSPLSTRYLGVSELNELFLLHGFRTEFFGYGDTTKVPRRQRYLRFGKWLASKLQLVPGSLQKRASLKRLYFGQLTKMPERILPLPPGGKYVMPSPLASDRPDKRYKVIYAAARKPIEI
jgi:ubiquinone/menaquinone biosynthesis C-methylase UbiE